MRLVIGHRRFWSIGCFVLLLLSFGLGTVAGAQSPRPAFALLASKAPLGEPVLTWTLPDRQVPRQAWVLRSTTDLRTTKDGIAFPIATFIADPATSRFCDSEAPQDVELSYQVKLTYADGRTLYSGVVFDTVPAPKLTALRQPSLFVDKCAYTLTLLDEGRPQRRFPVALGANPVNRKLHLDRASTPEGLYRISGVQPQAEYHRAYDLNYPNEVDKVRYRVLAERGDLPNPTPDIGGEIQIHGCGITGNWTWGCIALRDSDMDLLFSRPELRSGIPVMIAGAELTLDDLQCHLDLSPDDQSTLMEYLVDLGIASGRSAQHWLYGLCKFQAQHGLLVTGVFDRSTRRLLVRQGKLPRDRD